MGQVGVEHISLKPGGISVTLSAVAHPNLQIALAVFISKVGDVLQKFCVAVLTNFCVAELTLSAAFNFAAELLSHCLHAVANA